MNSNLPNSPLLVSVRELIEQSRQHIATSVNAAMSLLYWQVGRRVNDELSQYSSAESYGKQLVNTLSRQLEADYGASFGEKNLRRMMQFAKAFPDEQIVVSLIRQLSWFSNSGDYYCFPKNYCRKNYINPLKLNTKK